MTHAPREKFACHLFQAVFVNPRRTLLKETVAEKGARENLKMRVKAARKKARGGASNNAVDLLTGDNEELTMNDDS